MSRITQADLDSLVLKKGAHDPDSTYCVMEAHAAIVGDKWTDSPPDVSSVIAALMRSWNDSLPDDESRTRLLVPILREGVMRNTATGDQDDTTRAWLALDWLAREHLPTWLDLSPALTDHATKCRALPSLNRSTIDAAMPIIRAAGAAARFCSRRCGAWAGAGSRRGAAARGGVRWGCGVGWRRGAAWDAAGMGRGLRRGLRRGMRRGVRRGLRRGVRRGVRRGMRRGLRSLLPLPS
jgi:hypothetical protein